jgi:hypothetical protein
MFVADVACSIYHLFVPRENAKSTISGLFKSPGMRSQWLREHREGGEDIARRLAEMDKMET